MNRGVPIGSWKCGSQEVFYYSDGSVKVVPTAICSKCRNEVELDRVSTDDLICDSCKKEETPLLVIEVKDLDSIPVVKYKGQELKGKVLVDYIWETKDHERGTHNINLEYCDKESLTVHRIGLERLY